MQDSLNSSFLSRRKTSYTEIAQNKKNSSCYACTTNRKHSQTQLKKWQEPSPLGGTPNKVSKNLTQIFEQQENSTTKPDYFKPCRTQSVIVTRFYDENETSYRKELAGKIVKNTGTLKQEKLSIMETIQKLSQNEKDGKSINELIQKTQQRIQQIKELYKGMLK